MKKLLLAVSVMLGSVAVAQTQYPPGAWLSAPELEVMWVALRHVDLHEIPMPPLATVWSCTGLDCVSTAEESTGYGVRYLRNHAFMTPEGAEKAVQMIRAALQEYMTYGPNRTKDHCAANAIPSHSLAAIAAYLEEERRIAAAKRAQLVDDFLEGLSPEDALAFRQWALGSGEIKAPPELPRLEPRQWDPNELAAVMCSGAGKQSESTPSESAD